MNVNQKIVMKVYHTWLYFFLYEAIGDEFLEYNLPAPNYLLHAQRGIFIGWIINGYPGTKKSREYFNDIIARFIIAYKQNKPERLPYKPTIEREALFDINILMSLKTFKICLLYTGLLKRKSGRLKVSEQQTKYFGLLKYTQKN